MTRIEFSLAPITSQPAHSLRFDSSTRTFDTWLAAVVAAEEPCLLLDNNGVVAGASVSCAELIGAGTASSLLGRGFLDGVFEVVDFTARSDKITNHQLVQLPPLMALSSGTLARALIRIRAGDEVRTLDAISSPLTNSGQIVGSLTFFLLL